jgi:hypothetical protein
MKNKIFSEYRFQIWLKIPQELNKGSLEIEMKFQQNKIINILVVHFVAALFVKKFYNPISI